MPSATDQPDRSRIRIARMLEATALFVLLLNVAMRPLIGETYSSAMPSIVAAAGDAGSLTPVTTAVFDLLVWLAMGTVLVAAALEGRRLRWSGIEIGWLLMLVGAIVSTLAASNKRLAINASCDWLTAGVLVVALVNLCRTRLRVALVLAVVVASGLTAAAKSAMQVTVEHRDVLEFYEAHREAFWKNQNVPLDDPRVTLYERRMHANEATGFIAYSNVQGAQFALAGFAALAAMGISGLPSMARRLLFGGTGALLLASILMTGSLGAMLSVAVGLGLWMLLQFVGRWWRLHWRVLLVAGWSCALLAGAVTLGWGLSHGTLPGDSLAFRWNYWTVTRDVIGEAPITGVGALNFDRAYLRHKPIQYPEEIRDPHDFILAVASQWGLFGFLGLMTALVVGSATAARRWSRGEDRAIAGTSADEGQRSAMAWILPLAAGFVLLRLVLMRSYFDIEAGAAVVFFDLFVYGALWVLATGLCVRGMTTGRAAGDGFAVPLGIATVAFLLHNTIGFAMFVPSALYTFAAVLGLLLACREAPDDSPHRRFASPSIKVAALIEGMGLVAVLVLVMIPTWSVNDYLNLARRTGDMQAYERAVDADHLDSAAAVEAAGAAWQLEPNRGRAVEAALRYLAIAVERDPLLIDARRRQVDTWLLRYGLSGDVADLQAALSAAESAVALYPASPDDRATLGDVLARLARARDSVEYALRALRQYETALDFDGVRRRMGELRQWPESRRREVEEAVQAMQALISST